MKTFLSGMDAATWWWTWSALFLQSFAGI